MDVSCGQFELSGAPRGMPKIIFRLACSMADVVFPPPSEHEAAVCKPRVRDLSGFVRKIITAFDVATQHFFLPLV